MWISYYILWITHRIFVDIPRYREAPGVYCMRGGGRRSRRRPQEEGTVQGLFRAEELPDDHQIPFVFPTTDA
jgi:hypothetical protein